MGLAPTKITDVFLQGTVPLQGINFAYGGAYSGVGTVGDPPGIFLPGLQSQLSLYKLFLNLNNIPGADPNALYVVWAGANDYLFPFDDEIEPNRIGTTTTNIVNTVNSLAELGAKTILVPNLANLSLTPRVIDQNEITRFNNITNIHNQQLLQKLDALRPNLPSDVSIISLDIFSLINNEIDKFNNNPTNSPYTNIQDSCLSEFTFPVDLDGYTICSEPDEYLFWDEIHPTAITHQAIANFAYSQLRPNIPETSLGLPILGFSVLMFTLNRRRRFK